jgi:predicted Ser/Thr protein kinase
MSDESRCEDPDKTLPLAADGSPERSCSDELPSDDRQLAEILDQYLAELQAGTAPDPDDLIRRHPHLAARLEACLAGLRFIHRAERSGAETPGQLGDFRLLREIGRGGMGVVYEAEQVSLGRRVAVKILRFAAVSDPEALDRFRREAETVARLHHTNIVPIFFVGIEGDVHYFAMQFIEGRSLADVLAARTSPVDARTVAWWGLQTAEALVHAHQRHVIHRDIKPSNLLLDTEDRLWLTDFGLAKRLDDVTLSMTGALLGTPRYMSPEQASAARQRTDHRTDLYSLGATLYEAATGQPVFSATTPHEVIQQILHQEPTPPRRVRPDLPRDLETVLLKCLAKQPEQRYADAESLADDLRAILDGRPVRARRASLWERTSKWARRQRRSLQLAAGSAVAGVLLLLAAFAVASAHRQAQTGYVQLSSAGVPLEAEILDTAERTMRRIRVPHEEPLALPIGQYRLRLSAPQQMSATYDFAVQRGMGWSGVLASWFSPRETTRILDSRRASLTYPVGLQRGRHGEAIGVGTGVVGVLESATAPIWSWRTGLRCAVSTAKTADWCGNSSPRKLRRRQTRRDSAPTLGTGWCPTTRSWPVGGRP